MTRRQFLIASGIIAGAGALGYYSIEYEPMHIVTERRDIRLRRLPAAFDGFRIAQLTDIHFGPNVGGEHVRNAVRIAQSFQPDLIVLTGDFVTHPYFRSHRSEGARYITPCAEILAGLQATHGLVAILGNHDHWTDAKLVAGELQAHGVKVLRNANHPLERGAERLWLAGSDDAFVGAADFDRTLAAIPPGECTLLLAHEPDVADTIAHRGVDLQLSGHSHGGQVKVPFLGPIILPGMARKYPEGLYRVGELQLYTSRGVGLINPAVRFNCPPEVSLFTLHTGV